MKSLNILSAYSNKDIGDLELVLVSNQTPRQEAQLRYSEMSVVHSRGAHAWGHTLFPVFSLTPTTIITIGIQIGIKEGRKRGNVRFGLGLG